MLGRSLSVVGAPFVHYGVFALSDEIASFESKTTTFSNKSKNCNFADAKNMHQKSKLTENFAVSLHIRPRRIDLVFAVATLRAKAKEGGRGFLSA